MSGFRTWDQLEHAEDWLLFPDNLGKNLSIDEVAISNGELYTIVTNKAAHGKKKALVAIVAGTKVQTITDILAKIPLEKRNIVSEATLDMSPAMDAIVRKSFPQSTLVTDRFHVQQLVVNLISVIYKSC